MYRHFENNDPQYKKQGNRANAKVDISGKLGYQAHDCCAKERRTFATNIHEAKIFTGFFRWDDLGKIRSGQCLNAALKHSN